MMKRRGEREQFSEALQGKKLPILTLDNKWYRLMDAEARADTADLEQRLNALLKRQGKLNTETKKARALKKKLMDEIVQMANEAEQSRGDELADKMEQHKNLLEECSGRLKDNQEELRALPLEIEEINDQLMLATMKHCYDAMRQNTEEIGEIADWVAQIRVELKKRLIRKQELEQRNLTIYSYMHDVFGADVVDIFDMRYDPDKQHPILPKREED